MTIAERVMEALRGNGNFRFHGTRPMMTASDIQRFINPTQWLGKKNHPNAPKVVGLSSLSSTLAKLVKSGKILRVKGFGPAGGYGYVRPHWDVPE